MKNIRLDDVVQLFRLANPVGHGKLALGQQGKNGTSGISLGTATNRHPVALDGRSLMSSKRGI